MKSVSYAALLAATGVLVMQPAYVLAQEAVPTANAGTQSAILSYDTAFFASAAPVTALDMVRVVPGFSISNGNTQNRGLADAFGNVLINGRRPANKTISVETILQRIASQDVIGIELIREPLPQYEMRGHSSLVNVLIREGAGGSGSAEARLTHFESRRVAPMFELSYSSSTGAMDYSLGALFGYNGPQIDLEETVIGPNGGILEIWDADDQRQYRTFQPNATLIYALSDATSLGFDFSGEYWEWHRTFRRNVYPGPDGVAVTPAFPLVRREESETLNDGYSWTASTSLNHAFNERMSSSTTLLASQNNWIEGPEPFATYDETGFVSATIFEFETENQEIALRQTVSWTPNDRHDLEFSAEGAFNFSDDVFALFFDDGTQVTEINLPVANTRVEERRVELGVNDVWTLSDTMSIEAGLRVEFSEISQTGDAVQERSFTYPKPSIALNWRPSDETRYRFSVEQIVDQLNFDRFASGISVSDNTTTVGNPDYRPQQNLRFTAEMEHRFSADTSITLRGIYERIEDVDDFIPVTTQSGNVFDAPGNIGSGWRLRGRAEWTTSLQALRIPNSTLSGWVELRDGEVTDPVTGQPRTFSRLTHSYYLDFRQSFPESGWTWGWDYYRDTSGSVFRATELQNYVFDQGDFDLFIETTRFGPFTTRLSLDALLTNGENRERVFYQGSRASGIISGRSLRNQRRGTEITLSIRRNF